jgi:hypothetical protein
MGKPIGVQYESLEQRWSDRLIGAEQWRQIGASLVRRPPHALHG